MNYPLISDYIESIKFAEDNFATLTNLRPVLDEDGQPIMSSGNFAVVFKMKDESDGKYYAVKCFLKDQCGRDESYRLISEELENIDSSYLVSVKYLEKELFVDSANCSEEEFPVLLMDWVEGQTLDVYIKNSIGIHNKMDKLFVDFCRLTSWLLQQEFSHGDLKPDNILVCDNGELVLVDYDGMYVPMMKGQQARELGSPNFRHPLRNKNIFDETIDDFPLITIAMSIKALSISPDLFYNTGLSDGFILTDEDFKNLGKSENINKMQSLLYDNDFQLLYGLFFVCFSGNKLSCYYDIFGKLYDARNIECTNEYILRESFKIKTKIDSQGVEYSIDYKYLIGMGWYGYSYLGDCYEDPYRLDCESYHIKEGTQVICDDALSREAVGHIYFPKTLRIIGEQAFVECENLKELVFPKGLSVIGCGSFRGCESLSNIVSDNFVLLDGALYDKNKQSLISYVSLKKDGTFQIPNWIKEISSYSFCDSSLGSIIVPNSVHSINNSAFKNCKKLTSIVLPAGLEEISVELFCGCEKLSSVFIPQSVYKIGAGAYEGCSSLTKIGLPNNILIIEESTFSGCSKLESIHVSSSVKSIEGFAFQNCCSLSSVELSEGLRIIGKYAFYKCYSINVLIIPSSVKSIGEGAFKECTGLKKLIVLNPNIEINSKAFAGCINLCSIQIDTSAIIAEDAFEDCNNIPSINGIQYVGNMLVSVLNKNAGTYNIIPTTNQIASRAFFECKSMFKFIIPENVLHIGDYAFACCTFLSSINLPNSLNHIGSYAFSNNTFLHSIDIPNNVKHIGSYAFRGCSLLKTIKLYGSLSVIENNTFENCTGLHSVFMSDNISVINSYAFYGCTSLIDIQLSQGLKEIGKGAFERCKSLSEIKIPNGVSKIDVQAFCDCESLQIIEIPSSVATISNSAFKNCHKLINVKIQEGVEKIEAKAFFGCSHLEVINLPDSIKEIGASAFEGCSSLKYIHLPNGIKSISYDTFSGCSKLKDICLPKTVQKIGSGAFSRCYQLIINEFPKDLREIGCHAFYGCFNLCPKTVYDNIMDISWEAFMYSGVYVKNGVQYLGKYIVGVDDKSISTCVLPENLLGIADCAFRGCKKLQELHFPDTVKFIGSGAFADCNSLKHIRIPDKVRQIKNATFERCESLTSLSLANNINSIEKDAFKGCMRLERINIMNLESWYSIKFDGFDSNPLNNKGSLYLNNEILNELRIDDKLEKIREHAYNYCQSVETVILGKNIKQVCSFSFYRCSNLQNIIFNNKLETIGSYAFYGCTSIKEIELPEGLTSIGNEAFSNCTSLKVIKLPGTIQEIKYNSFKNCSGIESIFVSKRNYKLVKEVLEEFSDKIIVV